MNLKFDKAFRHYDYEVENTAGNYMFKVNNRNTLEQGVKYFQG